MPLDLFFKLPDVHCSQAAHSAMGLLSQPLALEFARLPRPRLALYLLVPVRPALVLLLEVLQPVLVLLVLMLKAVLQMPDYLSDCCHICPPTPSNFAFESIAYK